MNIEILRVQHPYQLTGVHYVRIQGMVKEFSIPLEDEFEDEFAGIPDADFKYVLALDGVLPVGTCRLHVLDSETAKIERVCVIGEYRNKGIGALVIGEAEQWFREMGIKKIQITSREEAVRFYEMLGYVTDRTGPVDTEIFTLWLVEKKL